MNDHDLAARELGDEPPLNGAGRNGPPDRREISARWLSGTVLTGVTSSVLMGVALFAALDAGNIVLRSSEPLTPRIDAADAGAGEASKTGRVATSRILTPTSDRRRMEISTLQREDDVDIVRTVPFVHVEMALAAGHTTDRDYPAFDPLDVFAEDGAPAAPSVAMGQIYGARVESEVSLRMDAFPLDTATYDTRSALTADEVEAVVRNTGAILTDGDIQVAALHYVDPQRFGDGVAGTSLSSYGIRVVPENVSIAPRERIADAASEFAEDMVIARREGPVVDLLAEAGYDDEPSAAMAGAVARMIGSDDVPAGSVLRIGLEIADDESRIMRATLYRDAEHWATVAIDDDGQFVPGDEPEPNPAISIAMQGSIPVIASGSLPTAYDGIYRAAYSYGLNRDMTRQLVRLLAADVDFQARLSPTDRIELFFSNPDSDDNATSDSELLYVGATFGSTTRNFYRFEYEDGSVDYFDEEGRSARPFLLRNPVPNGRFTSGFGSRRHPILGRMRAHTGVDWAAPRGTPIIASGNGVVEEAGWSGGYGRHTVVRHANGYVSSYSHQSAIADGIKVGARIRQGQVIGYVGSTGLSTGNHLHYELIVNGTKVDPMRVRLPQNRSLEGEELEAFQYERERIVALLNGDPVPPLRMAQNSN